MSGWVRNRLDGSVEALISGPAEVVDGMLEAFRVGPPASKVEDVTTEPAEIPGDGFRTLPTA